MVVGARQAHAACVLIDVEAGPVWARLPASSLASEQLASQVQTELKRSPLVWAPVGARWSHPFPLALTESSLKVLGRPSVENVEIPA